MVKILFLNCCSDKGNLLHFWGTAFTQRWCKFGVRCRLFSARGYLYSEFPHLATFHIPCPLADKARFGSGNVDLHFYYSPFFMFIDKLQVIGSSTTILFFWHFQQGWFVFCEYKVALISTAYTLIIVCLCPVLDWDSCSCWWKQCRVLTRLVYEVESNQRCSLSKLGLSHGPTT